MPLGLKNTNERYGTVAIVLHWAMAALIIPLFIVGIYMTGLPYTDPWNTTLPHLHKGFGLIVFFLLIARTLWRLTSKRPRVEGPAWERGVARAVHISFYILLFIITINGYLIPTADGSSIELFNWLEVPAILSGIDHQEDIAGRVHYIAAIILMILTALHILAAFKHHFIDKDSTLKNIFGTKK
jgi:cytochrome b561